MLLLSIICRARLQGLDADGFVHSSPLSFTESEEGLAVSLKGE